MNSSVKINNRNYNLDLLRILACFMVILIHVCAYHWYDISPTSFNWKVYNLYESAVRSAVPIFIMLSGVFFLNNDKKISIKKLYLKNILKLVIIFIIFSILYMLYELKIRNYNLGTIYYIRSAIGGPFHFWYIPVIIGLYVITPILRLITLNCNKKTFKYFFIIFMIGCLIKTFTYFNFIRGYSYIEIIISKLPLNVICQFYSYFLLGYFLNTFKISKKHTNLLYILGIASIFLCAISTYIICQHSDINITAVYNEFSIFTFFEAVALFLFFKNKTFISEQIYSDKISKISSYTLGIYIIHIMVMYSLFDFNIIHITDFNTLLSVPIISILIFIICLTIVYIYKKAILKTKELIHKSN